MKLFQKSSPSSTPKLVMVAGYDTKGTLFYMAHTFLAFTSSKTLAAKLTPEHGQKWIDHLKVYPMNTSVIHERFGWAPNPKPAELFLIDRATGKKVK